MSATPRITHRLEHDSNVLQLGGSWRLAHLPVIAETLRTVPLREDGRCVIDGGDLQELDTSAAFTLLRQLAARGVVDGAVVLRAFDARHARLLALVQESMRAPAVSARSTHLGLIQRIGAAAARTLSLATDHLAFLGAVVLDVLPVFRRPRSFRLRETVSQFEAVGLDAIPIAALVNFLIGLVVFLLVRAYNRFRAKAPPAEAPAQEKLLSEIRDLLKEKKEKEA